MIDGCYLLAPVAVAWLLDDERSRTSAAAFSLPQSALRVVDRVPVVQRSCRICVGCSSRRTVCK